MVAADSTRNVSEDEVADSEDPVPVQRRSTVDAAGTVEVAAGEAALPAYQRGKSATTELRSVPERWAA